MPLTTKERWGVFALIVFNVVLKCCWLNVNELAHDEPYTVYWSQRSLGEIWSMLASENNPPLHFLLIKAWSAIAPFEVPWLRVPSALFSALTAWPLFLISRQLTGQRGAWMASLLFTFTNYHFGFAHEVRGYSLFALLASTSMWLLVQASAERRTFWLSVVNVLLVYTHFFGWLCIGIQLLVVLLPSFRAQRKAFIIALTIAVASYLPYAVVFVQRLGQSVGHGTWLTPPAPEELYNMIWRWSNAPVLAVVFLVFLVVACIKDRVRHIGLRVGLIWAFVPLVAMFVVSYQVPMFLDRYLVYAAPGFALLVASSLAVLLPKSTIGNLVHALPVMGMAVTFTPWKAGPYHPSQVVAAADAYCTDGCTQHIWPAWYHLTFISAEKPHTWPSWDEHPAGSTANLNALKEDQSPYLQIDINTAAVLTHDADLPTIVVDASGNGRSAQQPWYRTLKATYPVVDSVEADRKIWVYRFSR